ncbi:UDP-forming cellulose synthase catalytic subunit [Sphingomonas naphthae]|uniref:Cellulose synthase catalytic subunit [UDP-forming] n=1 Tax=Sphingomonas naphthae TaxID=1813468 RepID=A0ABY7TJD2_9SPHN|nr:UDP-forming cellulose synthase catalytic subunit [Sphingomonas naphthae]WCT73310.1 UDP-forming cellulose synthase catalytic subunit [Sphingomonas naphthae]
MTGAAVNGKMQRGLYLLAVIVVGLIVAGAAVFVVAVPLDLWEQWAFGLVVILASLVVGRWKSRQATVMIFALSFLASTRYLYWRTTQTLEFDSLFGMLLGIGLYLAEFYAYVILLLGFLQTGWPLKRTVVELEGADEDLPIVDVFIPTYNESLAIVRETVFAAMAMDYPADRFAVYILDDGRREEFRDFATAVGCGYITRDNNLHAKAGNLNEAMKKTSGELLCIFDADHIPTRAFLQLTVGWFQRDNKLGLLQTPHHFYSPEPAQRNLVMVEDLPSEGDLFYGSVQSGNDLWNATFFCGSCAILKRDALMEVGGFAGETVTEDAHTALKIQRKGWSSGYINVRLAAGLATERLALHIGQRARWARGMTQILRIDNPMLGRGLHFGQRLCYLNAMLHFQYPLPRIVFLTSPLCYLLFGYNVIHAPASLIFAYAVPHLINSSRASTRVQAGERRLFWSEIYETILCFHLVKPTVLTLFNPRKGKFNVTDKGGLLDKGYFDFTSVKPHVFTACLLALGLFIGVVKLLMPATYGNQFGTLLLNTAWTLFSLMILTAAIAVARESRQVRQSVRIDTVLPVTVYFADGHVVDAHTTNASLGGLAIDFDPGIPLEGREITDVVMETTTGRAALPVEMIAMQAHSARVSFNDLNPAQARALNNVVMGRADAWQPDRDEVVNRPRGGLTPALDVFRAAGSAIFQSRGPRRRRMRLRDSVAALLMLFMGLAALLPTDAARAQSSSQNLQGAAPGAGEGARGVTTDYSKVAVGMTRDIRASFKDFGIEGPVRLATVRGEVGIPFGMRRDEVAVKAQLTINFAYSPVLIEQLSRMVILINGEVVQSIPLLHATANNLTVTMPVDPALIVPGDNRLNLRFLAHYKWDCEDPLHSSLWANVSNTRSFLDVTMQRLPTRPDLGQLPLPFFDRLSAARLVLPFVFAGNPDEGTLEAAGSVASYFGMLASYRGATFTPVIGEIPMGNAVVFMAPGQQLPGMPPIRASGSGLALIPNPRDPLSMLLVVIGNNAAQLKAAAAALSVGSKAFGGQAVSVSNTQIPTREAYDAPRWLNTKRVVRLGEFTDPQVLQGSGLPPGALSSTFRVAPDLFFWPRGGAKLTTRYRYPTAAWLDRGISRLDLSLNGQYLQTFPLEGTTWVDRMTGKTEQVSSRLSERSAELPTYALFGQNRLTFFYDLQLADKRQCQGTIPTDVRVSVDPDSTIDATGAWHYARLPNLAYFASAGFPFTRKADLTDTVVVLSPQAGLPGIEAYLALMGRFGDSTGAPVTGVSVVRAADEERLRDKDILLIGTVGDIATAPLFEKSQLMVQEGNIRVRSASMIDRLFGFLSSTPHDEVQTVNQFLVTGQSVTGYVSFRSPFTSSRTVVAVVGQTAADLPPLVYSLKDPKVNAQVQGDFSVRSPDGMTSFNVTPGYWVGNLPVLVQTGFWFSRHPFLLGVLAVIIALLISVPVYFYLKSVERKRLSRNEEG